MKSNKRLFIEKHCQVIYHLTYDELESELLESIEKDGRHILRASITINESELDAIRPQPSPEDKEEERRRFNQLHEPDTLFADPPQPSEAEKDKEDLLPGEKKIYCRGCSQNKIVGNSTLNWLCSDCILIVEAYLTKLNKIRVKLTKMIIEPEEEKTKIAILRKHLGQDPDSEFSVDHKEIICASMAEYASQEVRKALQEQTELRWSDKDVAKFTQNMIMQYKSGNTNIEQLLLIKENLIEYKKSKS